MKDHIAKFFKFIEDKDNKALTLPHKLLRQDIFTISQDELYYIGSIDLSYKNITTLPDNLNIRGYFDMRKVPLTKLPNNLTVAADLDIRHSNVSTIPINLKVDNDLYIKDTPLAKQYTEQQIRNIITSKGGYVKYNIIL